METTKTSPVIEVTEAAARKAVALSEAEGHAEPYLRLRVIAGGCSGFAHRLSFEDGPAEDDHIIEAFGLRVLVDPKSAPIVQGSTLEFLDRMLGGGFKVNNPRAVHECACGDSFALA